MTLSGYTVHKHRRSPEHPPLNSQRSSGCVVRFWPLVPNDTNHWNGPWNLTPASWPGFIMLLAVVQTQTYNPHSKNHKHQVQASLGWVSQEHTRRKTLMTVSLTAQVTVELQFSGEVPLKDTLGHPWDLTGVRSFSGGRIRSYFQERKKNSVASKYAQWKEAHQDTVPSTTFH